MNRIINKFEIARMGHFYMLLVGVYLFACVKENNMIIDGDDQTLNTWQPLQLRSWTILQNGEDLNKNVK